MAFLLFASIYSFGWQKLPPFVFSPKHLTAYRWHTLTEQNPALTLHEGTSACDAGPDPNLTNKQEMGWSQRSGPICAIMPDLFLLAKPSTLTRAASPRTLPPYRHNTSRELREILFSP